MNYVLKAQRAIETNQPNLAMLYMRRGIQESKKNNPNPMLDFKYGVQAFAEAMNSLFDVFGEVAKVFYRFGQDVQSVYDREFYELVNDNEG